MRYGIYFAYWEKEWNCDQTKYVKKVKKLGFDTLEISCAILKRMSDEQLREFRRMAEDEGVVLTAGLTGRLIIQNKLTKKGTGQRVCEMSGLSEKKPLTGESISALKC